MSTKALMQLTDDQLRILFYARFLLAEVKCGEAVGVLAGTVCYLL